MRGFRAYLSAITGGNLAWETLQLPLYTIWETGAPRAQAIAVVHCTGGDLLIALSALMLALLLAGHKILAAPALLARSPASHSFSALPTQPLASG